MAISAHLPHSSASGWECWAGASAHKPLFSSPPLMDLTEPGRSREAGSPHECLKKKMRKIYTVFYDVQPVHLQKSNTAPFMHHFID